MRLIKTTPTLKIKDNVRRDTFSRRICCPKLIGRIINNEISTSADIDRPSSINAKTGKQRHQHRTQSANHRPYYSSLLSEWLVHCFDIARTCHKHNAPVSPATSITNPLNSQLFIGSPAVRVAVVIMTLDASSLTEPAERITTTG